MKLKVALGLIFICFLIGCRSTDEFDYKGDTRIFKTISSETYGRVVYDKRTGVEYWISYGYSNVLTVLVDEDGKPLIYDRSAKE